MKKTKINELFTFDNIQAVIKIEEIPNEEEMVKNFVISQNLKEDLSHFLSYLNGDQVDNNISVNIIGNYGTGKSHLLAFISLLLSNPSLIKYVQDEEIKNKFSNLKKEFLVVKYELPATQQPLVEIFYYRVIEELKKYGIEIGKINYNGLKDHKEILEEILIKIKDKYPSKGLIVIFDEYSDFIRQKSTFNEQQYDLNFTRQLAESSSNQDFILMLSMQEHIFSSKEFKASGELISKIEQRFLKINITSENVEDIISYRMVKKNENQIQKIRNLFEDLTPKFQNLAVNEDKFVELFPVHPYVIEVFSKISFFENRTILQFISNEINKILDKDFPEFITYDLIYSSMVESEHEVKNKEEVKPVIDVIKSLKDIVNNLDKRYQKNAIRLIHSLAIKNLITPPNKEGEKKGGDTPEKFAEDLLIIPKSLIMSPSDDINTILNKLIEQSVGKLINKDEKTNVFYLDIDGGIDLNQLINNKSSKLGDWQYINQKFVEEFLLEQLEFEIDKRLQYYDTSKKYLLETSVKWKERNSYREGNFIIDIGNKIDFDENLDFTVVLAGYGKINEYSQTNIVIKPKYNDEFSKALKRFIACEELIKSHAYPREMKTLKDRITIDELKPSFVKCLLNGRIIFENKEYSFEELGIITEIISETIEQLKEKLLGEKLTEKYPNYPRFKAKLSRENIKMTMESVIKNIPKDGAVKNLSPQSTNILLPLKLYKGDALDISESEFGKIILNKLPDTGKTLDINIILEEFEKPPYGLQKEIVYLIIAILLRNGDIMLSSSRGKTYSSAEFDILFKNGLKEFEDIKYLKKEEGPGSETQKLFTVLDLDSSLLSLKKNHSKAFQQYSSKIEQIINDIESIKKRFDEVKHYENLSREILGKINDKIDFIDNVNFNKLKVNNLNGFKNLDYSNEKLKDIKEAYELIDKLNSLFNDILIYINSGISYMKNALKLIEENSYFFKEIDKKELENIYNDSKEITNNLRKLLKEDERNPLKGKIQVFKDKYKTMYYVSYENSVGEGVNWKLLRDIEESSEYNKLKILKGINALSSATFNEKFLKINSLKELQKDKLILEELNDNYHSNSSTFPDEKFKNINNQIEELFDETNKLYNQWIKQILEDIQDKKDKIAILEDNEKETTEYIINNNKLPDNIDNTTITAINNLLKDIKIEEINISELYNILTSDKETLKLNEFTKLIDKYIKQKTQGLDDDKVRIRIVKENDELN